MSTKLLWCFSVLLLLAGCGKGVSLNAVSGKVTLDGAAISGATISLSPVEGGTGKAATGISDESGAFSITDMTTGDKGAVAGEYNVSVLWYKPSADSSRASGNNPGPAGAEVKDDKAAHSKVAGPDALLPVAYQDPKKSGIKITVAAGNNDLQIPLDSKFKGK